MKKKNKFLYIKKFLLDKEKIIWYNISKIRFKETELFVSTGQVLIAVVLKEKLSPFSLLFIDN